MEPGRNNARVVVIDGKETVEIELTQEETALVNLEDLPLVAKHRWCALRSHEAFYAITTAKREDGSREKIHLHCLVMGAEKRTVHHKNCRPLDCRKENLRIGPAEQNSWNRGPRQVERQRDSQYKGVHRCKRTGRFRATITKDGKRARGPLRYGGLFRNPLKLPRRKSLPLKYPRQDSNL